MPETETRIAVGMRAALTGVLANAVLAAVKVVSGVVGNSYALVADGIESTTDIVSSVIVWGGLKIAAVPPDADHPYGHGKAEPLAGAVVALALFGAAIAIAIESVREIRLPHHAPAPFTLAVLLGVVVVKELLFRYVNLTGTAIQSTAVKGDAWHHRSDAITSAAAAIGITIALAGGRGYESADDWAALAACVVIVFNGWRILRASLAEIMDTAPPHEVEEAVRREAKEVPGVVDIEKCRVRKSGLAYLVDIHVEVDGDISVRGGHAIAHAVKDQLLRRPELNVLDALVHIEPARNGKR